MSEAPPIRVVGDVAHFPGSATGARHLVWWGNLGFMLIEGTAFLLAGGAYLYLMGHSPGWPPQGDGLPDLLGGTVFTLCLLASELPNRWLSAQAKAKNERHVRLGSLLMTGLGLILIGIRALELGHLNVRWDQDAYGSVVWMLMVLHTSHVATDLGDTGVQMVWLFTHEIGDDQYADVSDNCNYWTFVVLAWLPIYILVYWMPRWV